MNDTESRVLEERRQKKSDARKEMNIRKACIATSINEYNLMRHFNNSKIVESRFRADGLNGNKRYQR